MALPAGGALELSQDCKRLLSASLADSCFYLIDIEQARIIRKLTPNCLNKDGKFLIYRVDNNLKWMTIGEVDAAKLLWDIEADTLINVLPPGHYVRGVLSTLNRICAYSDSSKGDELINGLTMEVINQYPSDASGKGCWFDDEAGVFYADDQGRSLNVYDAITGEYIDSSPVGGSYGGMVRRSAGSDWVFYFGMLSSNGLGPLVNAAANLKTKEHVTMDDVLPVGHYQGWYFMATSGDVAYQGIGRDAWKFDPAAATCQLLVHQPYLYYSNVPFPSVKDYIIDQQFRWYIHTWGSRLKDSALLGACAGGYGCACYVCIVAAVACGYPSYTFC